MALAVFTTLLVVSCASDEMTDGNQLPDGKYPLHVSLTSESAADPWGTKAPQTRVSENTTDGNSSVWQDGDNITVQIGDDNTSTGTYKVNVNADGSVTGLTAETALYWKNTTAQKVKGWFPTNIANPISLNNQSSSLAYALYAETATTVDYKATQIALPFTHQLAKIRVVLSGAKKADVTDVKVLTYPSCTFTPNATTKITGSGTPVYIPMKKTTYDNGATYCWEANVVPGYTIAKAKVNGVECELTTTVTPEAGKWNEVTINVEKVPVEIQPGTDGNYTVKEGDKVIINGNGTESTASINITGTATVILNNVNLKNASNKTYVPVNITNGTATIILKGENTITGSGRDAGPSIQLSNTNSNVIINGTTGSRLTVSAYFGHAAIGSRRSSVCGDITIKNATIIASTSDNYVRGASAAIGSGASFDRVAGCGIITIIDSDIIATVTGVGSGNKPAVIGSGYADYDFNYSNSCKGISITLKAGQTKSDFLAKLTGEYNVQVGAGKGNRTTPNTCGYINWYNSDGTSAN